MTWLIVELQSGAMDGWYHVEEMALDCFEDLKQRHPRGQWVLLRLVDGRGELPESRFWVNVLGEGRLEVPNDA